MKSMPVRDTKGRCRGLCRDRIREGEVRRERKIASEPYSTPVQEYPSWAKNRNDTPGAFGGHGL